MKTICYISDFAKNLDSKTIDDLTRKVSKKKQPARYYWCINNKRQSFLSNN